MKTRYRGIAFACLVLLVGGAASAQPVSPNPVYRPLRPLAQPAQPAQPKQHLFPNTATRTPPGRLIPLEDALIKPIYERVCGSSVTGLRVLVPPRNADGSWVQSDPAYVLTELLRKYVREWIGGLVRSQSWEMYTAICVGIYDDVDPRTGQPSPNAFATNDHHIMMGRHLLMELVDSETGALDKPRFLYVLAHEFGHHLQFVLGHTHNAYPTKVVRELQADCIAGYILMLGSKLSQENAYYARALNQASEVGDFQFWNVQHHGTPAQRKEAVGHGMWIAKAKVIAELVDKDPSQIHLPAVETILSVCSKYPSDQQLREMQAQPQ